MITELGLSGVDVNGGELKAELDLGRIEGTGIVRAAIEKTFRSSGSERI